MTRRGLSCTIAVIQSTVVYLKSALACTLVQTVGRETIPMMIDPASASADLLRPPPASAPHPSRGDAGALVGGRSGADEPARCSRAARTLLGRRSDSSDALNQAASREKVRS